MKKCYAYRNAEGKGYGYCIAVKDCERCLCNGVVAQCDFYPKKKEEGNRMEVAMEVKVEKATPKGAVNCMVDMRALNRALGILEGMCTGRANREDSAAGWIMAVVNDIENAIVEAEK